MSDKYQMDLLKLIKLENYFNDLIKISLIIPKVIAYLSEKYPLYSFKAIKPASSAFESTVYLPDGEYYVIFYNSPTKTSDLNIVTVDDISVVNDVFDIKFNLLETYEIKDLCSFFNNSRTLPDYIKSIIDNKFELEKKVTSLSLNQTFINKSEQLRYDNYIKPILQKFIGFELIKL